jgi:hypothetical protein
LILHPWAKYFRAIRMLASADTLSSFICIITILEKGIFSSQVVANVYFLSFHTLKGYQKDFKRDECMLVEKVSLIAKSAKCHPNEARQTVLTALFDLYEDGTPQKIMDFGAMISPLQLIKLSYQTKPSFLSGGSAQMSCFNTRSTTY